MFQAVKTGGYWSVFRQLKLWWLLVSVSGIGNCAGYWSVFAGSGNCGGFWSVFQALETVLVTGQCFQAVETVLVTGQCFRQWKLWWLLISVSSS